MSTIKTWQERVKPEYHSVDSFAIAGRDSEITELREALKVAQVELAHKDAVANGYRENRDALQAKLSAIEGQENRCVRELREYAKKNPGTYIFPHWDGHRVSKYLAALVAPAQPDFDEWAKNPYTKVLEKSIANDYVPKHDQPVNAELVEALREAAAFIHAVNTGEKPEVRYPLADELDGYAAILASAKAAQPLTKEPTKPNCKECAKWTQEQADNKEWIEGVAKGNEIIRKLAQAEIMKGQQ